MSLNANTMHISDASRGVGLAIAKRAAKDRANVALIAKTAEPHRAGYAGPGLGCGCPRKGARPWCEQLTL
jgi:NAD(P)-dependent dehydrogenase (short-subunit alcohol dehydrogenase family)